MSTKIAINRPTSDESTTSKTVLYSINEPSTMRCSTSNESSNDFVNKEKRHQLEVQIESALKDRDEQWRRHEKAQIQFLQNETSNMLRSLHQEVNRLSNELREAKRISAAEEEEVENKNEENRKRSECNNEKINELQKALNEKELFTKNLEKKVTMTIQKLQDQIEIQSCRIRQLNDELNDRNQTVTHLSQQLRSIRLRDAMASSQHRRRASQQNSPPILSPSSPHRIFPPISSGLVSASIAVTYPGNSTRNSCQKTSSSTQRRSNSAMRAPSMPN